MGLNLRKSRKSKLQGINPPRRNPPKKRKLPLPRKNLSRSNQLKRENQRNRPRKRSRTITKKPKKLPTKKSLPRRKEKKWHKSLMLRNIHCTCNEFLKNQRAKKLLNKRLLDSVILKKL